MKILSVSAIPVAAARKAFAFLRRRSILVKVVRGEVTALEAYVPTAADEDKFITVVKNALGYDDSPCFRNTSFDIRDEK